MTRSMTLLVALLMLPQAVQAQAHGTHSPHTGLEQRDIQALSDDDVQGFLEGRGMGLAVPAELNSYPGPRHVLDLGGELELTDSQAAAIQAIYQEMHAAAVPLGRRYVERERELDRLFAEARADEERLRELTSDAGRILGELREVHLRAHLRTTALLTPHQVRRYNVHRGYAGGAAGHGHQ